MRSNMRKQSSLSSLHSKERHLLGVLRSWGLGRQPVGKRLLWTYEDLELGDSWVEECLPGTCKTPGSVPPTHTQTNTNKVDLQDSSILLNLNLRVFTYTHADFFRDSHHHLFLPFDNLRQGHKLAQSHCNTALTPKPNHHQLQLSCAACKRPSPLRRHALTGGGGQSPGTCTGVSSHFFQPVLAILPQLQLASRFQAEARVSMLGAGKICTVPGS